MAGRVAGKVALVTGGAMGIGVAEAQMLAAEGAHVIIADLVEPEAALLNETTSFIHLDVTNEDDWQNAMAHVQARFGRLNILVNNAGIVIPGSIEQATLAQVRRHLAVHVEGTFLGCQAALPLMRDSDGGSIVNTASVAAISGHSPFLGYAAAKGAVRAMSRSIAAWCQEQANGVRCNTVFPGGIDTPMIQAMTGQPAMAIPPGVLPKGAIGAPQDVAAAVLYLASDESRFLTGAEIVIDNGATALV